MNSYKKLYHEEFQNQIKAHEDLCDLTDRQIRDFERMQHIDSSQFPQIVANLLRERKSFQPFYHFLKQINDHLNRGY